MKGASAKHTSRYWPTPPGKVMGTRHRRVIVAMTGCLCGFVACMPSLAAENFKRLSADEVRRLFVGHTVTDEAHWSYRFGTGGELEAMDLGNTRKGVWRFSRNELCLDLMERGKPASECYEVWLSAKTVHFRRDGVLIMEGMLLDQ